MYIVVLSEQSLDDLERIEVLVASRSSSQTAQRYVSAIREFCESLRVAPHRGEQRSYLRRGLRSIGFKRRVSIVFSIAESSRTVNIARIWYAGHQGGTK